METNLRDFAEYLIGQGEEKVGTFTIEGRTFTNGRLTEIKIKEELASAVNLTTLTGIVDYIKAGLDGLSGKNLFLRVVSPSKVELFSELNKDRCREVYISCSAILPDNIVFDRFIPTEDFSIMLLASFLKNEDRDTLLKIAGNIVENNIKTTVDDGVSQEVVMKVGVASQGNVIVPNDVVLRPFRTFPEIEQPESKFIFRLKEGPKAALYQADGGRWRNEAMQHIKMFLQENLKEFPTIKIIS